MLGNLNNIPSSNCPRWCTWRPVLRPSAHNGDYAYGVYACHPFQTEILPSLTLSMTVSMSHTRFDSVNDMQGTQTSQHQRCVRCALPCRAAPPTLSPRQRSHLPRYKPTSYHTPSTHLHSSCPPSHGSRCTLRYPYVRCYRLRIRRGLRSPLHLFSAKRLRCLRRWVMVQEQMLRALRSMRRPLRTL